MLAVAMRVRESTGVSVILAVKPSSSRTTVSKRVSLTLRLNERMSPAAWVTRMASPGFKKSRLWRMPGKLRIAARSDKFKDRRLKMESSVSLRPTTISTRDAMPAC